MGSKNIPFLIGVGDFKVSIRAQLGGTSQLYSDSTLSTSRAQPIMTGHLS